MSSVADALRAGAQPLDASTELQTLDLTTADDDIAIEAGVYELCHNSSAFVVCKLNGTTAALPPATGVAGAVGFVIPPGCVVVVDAAAGDLHARTLAGTATLYIARKELA